MKNYLAKEFLFVFVLFALSVCLTFGLGRVNLIPSKNLAEIKLSTDLNVSKGGFNFKNVPANSLMFVNGNLYPYSIFDFFYSSSFYKRDIGLVPTSPYFKQPVGSDFAQLYLLPGKKNEYEAKLQINERSGLPIVSLIIDPDDFFSYENGIYVEGEKADFNSSRKFYPRPWNKPANYFEKGNDSKRKIFFSYYDKDGSHRYSSYAFARISGNATRCFPQKSIRLEASKELGEKEFKHDFFDNKKKYSSIVLRNGGNDNTKALFRDMLMQSLIEDEKITRSHFVPCEVFLNGEYWGIHFLQNRLDENFLAEKYSVKEKNITTVENWKLDQGSELEFTNLMNLMESSQKSFDYARLKAEIDIDNLVSFISGEVFFANTDWPDNNLKMYKVSNSINDDAKWRFAFFDLDYGFGYTGEESVSSDMFEYLFGKKDDFSMLFKNLMKNREFRSLLKNNLESLMQKELSSQKMISSIDALEKKLEAGVKRHVERWRKPSTVEEWKNEVELLRKFAEERERHVRHQIDKYLK